MPSDRYALGIRLRRTVVAAGDAQSPAKAFHAGFFV